MQRRISKDTSNEEIEFVPWNADIDKRNYALLELSSYSPVVVCT